MPDTAADADVLTGSRFWQATPDDYSSLRFLQFRPDGTGELTYGYGQTIYAVVPCRWDLPEPGVLRLEYGGPVTGHLAAGFTPAEADRVQRFDYLLFRGEMTGFEDITASPFRFLWTLRLDRPPWPPGLALPYKVPRVFHGHSQPG